MTHRTTRTAVALLCATAVAVLPFSPARADQVRNNQWHLRYLKVAEAHRISQGAGVTVAVIDSGVDPHPDLRNNLLPGNDTYPGGKGDGRTDTDGHGTGMAGLIAAHGRGSNGVLGIAPRAKIIPIRYFQGKDGDPDNAATGIEWAMEKGATIISVSAVSTGTPRLSEAVARARRSNVVIVAAAGNRPVDYFIGPPAICDGVVAVGATDTTGKLADVSVTGPQLAIAAPGVDISSTSFDGKYRTGTGTSPSTAIVAGAAALVRSKYPDLSAEEVVHRLTATAVDKGKPGRDEEYGYGVLDLVAALTADVPPLEGSPAPSNSEPAGAEPTGAGPAAPDPDNASSNSTTLVIALTALVVLGLLVTLLVLQARRRRHHPPAP